VTANTRGTLQNLDNEVSVADCGHAIHDEPLEAEFFRHLYPINAKGIARNGTATKRELVDILLCELQALEVGLEGCGIAEKPVAPSDRLCPLKMRVARHEVVDILLSTLSGDLEEIKKILLNQNQLITEPHAHIRRYLVVAAAARM
jgi:hypothetical protein